MAAFVGCCINMQLCWVWPSPSLDYDGGGSPRAPLGRHVIVGNKTLHEVLPLRVIRHF